MDIEGGWWGWQRQGEIEPSLNVTFSQSCVNLGTYSIWDSCSIHRPISSHFNQFNICFGTFVDIWGNPILWIPNMLKRPNFDIKVIVWLHLGFCKLKQVRVWAVMMKTLLPNSQPSFWFNIYGSSKWALSSVIANLASSLGLALANWILRLWFESWIEKIQMTKNEDGMM